MDGLAQESLELLQKGEADSLLRKARGDVEEPSCGPEGLPDGPALTRRPWRSLGLAAAACGIAAAAALAAWGGPALGGWTRTAGIDGGAALEAWARARAPIRRGLDNDAAAEAWIRSTPGRKVEVLIDPRKLCSDCVRAWNKALVRNLCDGRAPAEARRLGAKRRHHKKRKPGDDTTKIMRYPFRKGNMLYYGSQDLREKRIAAKSMVVFIHGAKRNAQDYLCSLSRLVDVSSLINGETILVVPKFARKGVRDRPRSDDCYWNGTHPAGDWRGGANTDPKSPCHASSYSIIDHLLHIASDREKFPIMTDVKILGFSAGAQLLQRYALVSEMKPPKFSTDEDAKTGKGAHHKLTVRYLIGNPSSFGYLDDHRWAYDCSSKEAARHHHCSEPTYAKYEPDKGRSGWDRRWGFTNDDLEEFHHRQPFPCRDQSFKAWPYALDHRHPPKYIPYLAEHPDLKRSVLEWYPNREVYYLIGTEDTCTNRLLPFCFDSCWQKDHKCASTIMDTKCPAVLQGVHRNMRAHLYMRHLEHIFGRRVHQLFEIPGVGHQAEVEMMRAVEMHLHGELYGFRFAYPAPGPWSWR